MRNSAHLLIAGVMAASPALALPPRYDVERHCREVASFGGSFSAVLYDTCFDMEQDAYDTLKRRWDGLPSAMRRHCDQVASFAGSGSYSLLETCVQMEEQAGSSGNVFQY
ncbi:hypothetical protein [Rubellimicrobium sp. CFH 75288]|uniref:hypothetical protein n=1 Tax=Rubellimicrobium sp. CFH 75288 TaxID=2697034 RepID=UPI0014121F11|nr:hypothetical protein [Rubellimicrobium sp. CFH 75288]NAZ38373.1 hypothetical protein [Rubellimicrobium sp. CFH 75288]